MGKDDGGVEIKIGNEVVIGMFPSFPKRNLLHRELQDALGYTEADKALIAQRERGDPMIPPSGEPDPEMATAVYWAAVGLCWPTRLDCPTLRQCKHDVGEYGDEVITALIRHQKATTGNVPKEFGVLVANAGSDLILAMVRDMSEVLTEEVREAKDFTGGPVGPSTQE